MSILSSTVPYLIQIKDFSAVLKCHTITLKLSNPCKYGPLTVLNATKTLFDLRVNACWRMESKALQRRQGLVQLLEKP